MTRSTPALALSLVLAAALPAAAEIFVELEAHLAATTVTSGGTVVQPMAGFGPGWGGDAQIFWRPDGPGSTLRTVFSAPPGTYDVVLGYTVAPDYGDVAVSLAGGGPVRLSGYGSGVAVQFKFLGRVRLDGAAELRVTVEGRDPRSSGFLVGLDNLELRPVDDGGIETTSPPSAPQVAVPALKRMPQLRPLARHEFVAIEEGTLRLGRVDDGGSIMLGGPQPLPEGLNWVGNLDGALGDELLTWDPASGDHFITRFSAGGAATSEKVGKSFAFDDQVFRTVGQFAEPGSSCLFGWREGRSFGIRSLVDGVCFTASALFSVEGVPVGADVTGDGRDEAVFITPEGTLDVMVLGEAYTAESASFPLLEYSQQRAADRWSPGLEIAVANVDDDPGREILAVLRGKGEVWRLDFDAAGRVENRVLLVGGWPEDWTLGWPLDVDGDGREELLVRSWSQGELRLARVTPTTIDFADLDGARSNFSFPGRFQGGTRHALLLQRIEGGVSRFSLFSWDGNGKTTATGASPATAGGGAIVLVGDFLPD